MSFEMKQVRKIRGKWSGAAADDIVDCTDLAKFAWGERAEDPNSGLIAFAYLWRRFGPPWRGSDEYKRLVSYTLTTPDPDVLLCISPSGSDLSLGVSYFARRHLADEFYRPRTKWEGAFNEWFCKVNKIRRKSQVTDAVRNEYFNWRCDKKRIREAERVIGKFPLPSLPGRTNWKKGPPAMQRVNKALVEAMKDLLRPVYIRDVPINIFGRASDAGFDGPEAKASIYAGFGVPFEAMESARKKAP